jgi:BASS family bile acid:Na+ symporter
MQNLQSVILLLIRASVVLTVFSIGLRATPRDLKFLLQKPGLLARSFLSMNVVMPVVAVALAAAFDLRPAVKVALVALSVSPVPPLFPRKAFKVAGEAPYIISLLIVSGVAALFWVTFSIDVIGGLFGKPVYVPFATVFKVVGITVLLPLIAGVAGRAVFPRLYGMAPRLGSVAFLLLIASFLPFLFSARQAIASLIGNGTLAAMVVFALVGLLAGHLLGGPNPNDRSTLALSSVSRHPAMAMAIGSATFPDEKLVPAAVLLYLLVNAVVCIPYVRNRRFAAGPAAAST